MSLPEKDAVVQVAELDFVISELMTIVLRKTVLNMYIS